MLARIRDNGLVVVCDACQMEITDNAGVIVWEKDGPRRANVMVVHKGCQSADIVKMLYPRSVRQQPLSQFLENVLEGVTV